MQGLAAFFELWAKTELRKVLAGCVNFTIKISLVKHVV